MVLSTSAPQADCGLTGSDSVLSPAAFEELFTLGWQLSAHIQDAAVRINAGFDDAEFGGELLFEVEDCSRVSVIFLEVVEPAVEEISELGERSARLRDLLDQFDEVRRREGSQVVDSEAEAWSFDTEILENMQIAFSRGVNFHFTQIKEVQFASERALGAAGPFRDGLDDSVLVRAPVHDQARLGERGSSNQCASCFQVRKIVFYL